MTKKLKSLLLTSCSLITTSLLTLASCSIKPLPTSDQNHTNTNTDTNNGVVSPYKQAWNIPKTNKTNFETWNNKELSENNFSTIGSNNKLDIVPLRGADDIKDPTFSSRHINTDPLQGTIVNEKYLNLAKISYSVNFAQAGSNNLGTAWLLDFQVPNDLELKKEGNSFNDTNYPTKWYLATNSHVMDDLKTNNSIYEILNTKNYPNKATTSVVFKRLKDPKIGEDWKNITSNRTDKYDVFNFNMSQGNDYKALDDPGIRPVFLGFDYLNSSPKDFINNVPRLNEKPDGFKYEDTEELADFSVFEIDFEKIVKNIPSSNVTTLEKNPHKLAKEFTSNYANWKEQDRFKPAEKSLLSQGNEAVKDKKFYVLGFPQEYVLTKTETSKSSPDVALYTNLSDTLKDQKDQWNNASSFLTEEKKYSTFKNFPGIFDSIIGSADFGYKHQPLQSNTVASSGLVPYIFQGLMYVDNNGDMYGGSSGSIFVDENNNIYGIHFASDWTAHIGINFALKSEGYNYNGAYGIYDLQPYDLINGGYSNQKSSYKDQLKKLYKNQNIKTMLFDKGINNNVN